jgi:hypothetical protein
MHTKFKYISLLIGVLTAFVFNPSIAGDNPLIGSWRWDNVKTLQNLKIPTEGSDELMKSAHKAKTFVQSVAKNLRSNMVLTYRDNECDQITFDNEGRELSRHTMAYRLVEVRKDVVIVDQLDNGGVVKLFRDGDKSFYVEVKVGEFAYRDYFTRQ